MTGIVGKLTVERVPPYQLDSRGRDGAGRSGPDQRVGGGKLTITTEGKHQ